MTETAIATWFVADKPGEETDFPQVGGVSSSTSFQNTYWRCIACFFDSSLRLNPGMRHILFTNTNVPVINGVDLTKLFRRWGIQTVHLPITFRVPRGASRSWGNQFYILDIIKYAAENKCSDNIIVLDSDCVWTMSVEKIAEAISKYGCLTYTLDDEHYALNARINGVTRQEMAIALQGWISDCAIDAHVKMQNTTLLHYHGGEIFAATNQACRDLALLIDSLWGWWVKAGPDGRGIKEEAHFLSILYASRAYSNFTANAFIERMWTTFRVNNVKRSDSDLAIWHLPAEKKIGFSRLFREITGSRQEAWATASQQEYNKMLARFMGIPRRNATKLYLDLCVKLADKAKGVIRTSFMPAP